MNKIITKKLDEITPYDKNPRNNKDAIKYVANSIEKFGFKNPIIIDKDGVIICGHTRYEASKQLGLEQVPCVIADDLTEEQIKAFRIADNKTAEIAEWDEELLAEAMKELDDDVDMTLFGYNNFEIHSIVDDIEPEEYDAELIAKYAQNADNYLMAKVLIIRYEDKEINDVKKLFHLGEEDHLKVLYDVEEVKKLTGKE